MKKMVERILWVWIMFLVLDAPLRFVFTSVGIPYLVYIKDMLIVVLFLVAILKSAVQCRLNKVLLAMLALLTFGTIVGLLNRLAPLQVLFGAKIFLTFVIGFIAVHTFGLDRSFFTRLFKLVVPVVLVGLVLEILYDLPWKGFEYDAFGTSIETSRNWTMFGLPRLSGFGRASFETAAILYSVVALYLGTLLLNRDAQLWRRPKLEIFLIIMAVAGIFVTTSKSAILSVLLLLLVSAAVAAYHRYGRIIKLALSTFIKFALCALFLYSIVPPAIAYIKPAALSDHLTSDNLIVLTVTGSYVDRIEFAWPHAYGLITSPLHYLSGRGIGGIGSAQFYFEGDRYSAADSFWVYFLVDFGLVILIGLVCYLLYQIFRSRLENRGTALLYIFALTLFCFGATGNVIESSALTISMGFMLAMWRREASDVR